MDPLFSHPRIAAARAHLERTDQVTLERQAVLSAVPAPTGAEALRATRVAELFREVGLANVKIDTAGNVLGWLGERGTGGPVVLAAHLDTVFGPEIDVTVQRHGARLEGPGISDNARGLAALIALAEACVRGRVETPRPPSRHNPRTTHHAPLRLSFVSAAARASTRFRRNRGSISTCAARTRTHWRSWTAACARRCRAPRTKRTTAARRARRRCSSRFSC